MGYFTKYSAKKVRYCHVYTKEAFEKYIPICKMQEAPAAKEKSADLPVQCQMCALDLCLYFHPVCDRMGYFETAV